MTSSFTFAETASTVFTITHARHMSAKVAADLKRIQRFYRTGPSDHRIADYETELANLLKAGYPDALARERFGALVGLDDHKQRLAKTLGLLVNPGRLEAWARAHHPDAAGLIRPVLRRPPLVILAGDVGTGKTELAETIGDAVARAENVDLTLLPLSLASRGQGRVGEMTQLLAAAFEYTVREAQRLKSASGAARGAVLLMIDEADALAQSREAAQMHHEDRAGVNALIRGINRLTNERLPAAVIMCTNRLSALDPAVQRRAADILSFERPDDAQRRAVLTQAFASLDWAGPQIEQLVAATGAQGGRSYGFTFSDLVQRLIPAIVLDAYPARPVEASRAIQIARGMAPTPPFTAKA